MQTDTNTIHGIQRRGKDGKKVSASSKRSKRARARVRFSLDPQIARRQALLGRFGHLAWEGEAGYPLGLYFLRGDVSEEQLETGKWYAREAGFARKVIAAPKAEARTVNLGEGGRDTAVYEPSERDLRRVARFRQDDDALRHNWPTQARALQLCILEDLWHNPAQRDTKHDRPAYTLGALIEALAEVEKWRG